MKNRKFILLIVVTILSFSLVGCTSIKDRIVDSINPFAKNEQNNDSTENQGKLIEGISDALGGIEGVDADELSQISDAVNSLSNAGDREVTGDYTEVGKYKVDEILSEDDAKDFGLYGVTYYSSSDLDNVIEYFDELFIGTPDYARIESDEEQAVYIYGTLNGNWVSVLIENEEDQKVKVSFSYFYEVEE